MKKNISRLEGHSLHHKPHQRRSSTNYYSHYACHCS